MQPTNFRKKGSVSYLKDTKQMIRIVRSLRKEYYEVEFFLEALNNRVVHETDLNDNPYGEPVEFHYGEGKFFSDKSKMAFILFYISLVKMQPFQGITYVSETEFYTKFGDENKQFRVEELEYDKKYFRWTNNTFHTGADFTFQFGTDFVRVFNNEEVYWRLTSNMYNSEGKIKFEFVKDSVKQSGAISSNKENTKFGCVTRLVDDLVYTGEVFNYSDEEWDKLKTKII